MDIDNCLIILKEMYQNGKEENKIEVDSVDIEALEYAIEIISFVKLIKYSLNMTK